MDACTVVFSVVRIASGSLPIAVTGCNAIQFSGILCTLAKMYNDNIRHFYRISRTIEKRPQGLQSLRASVFAHTREYSILVSIERSIAQALIMADKRR